ncbi:MAG: sce7726 family protein [Salegentibacter mishustinae]|nr:sce7726 family protein [Salegentibacter mishustinae]
MKEIEIKVLLVKYFLENYNDCTLGAEVPFQFGERRADMVIYESNLLSAFEIKGSKDTTSRLDYQIESYKKFFDCCYIVCERSNLSEIRKSTPRDVGILIAEDGELKKIRKSKQFKKHDKLILSSTISTLKLKKITGKNKLRSKSELCEHLKKTKTLDEIRKLSRDDFEERYGVVSRLLKQETTLNINSDDIHTITKRPPSSLIKRSIS